MAPLKIFLAGVGCVGKTAIGACLAKKLGFRFCDLDVEIEKHFGKAIERLRTEALTPCAFRQQFASVVLQKLVQTAPDAGFVIALFPSGMMDSMWSVLKNSNRVVVVLADSAKNILSQVTFYDAESRPITTALTKDQRRYYLKDIRRDMAYFGRSYRRDDLTARINGLDIEASAAMIQALLSEAGRAGLPGE